MSALNRLREEYEDQVQGVLDDEMSDLTIEVSANDLFELLYPKEKDVG